MTTENTPFKDDLLNRQEFANRLYDFLSVEQKFVDGALVITLQAPFGSGKTYFLQNWKTALEEQRKANQESPRVISLNAWESDYCGDPLLALISAILNELDDKKESSKEKIVEALKDIFHLGIGAGNSIIAATTPFNLIEIGEHAERKKQERHAQKSMTSDVLASLEKKKKALDTIKIALRELFEGDTMKAIVMVDELDRCRPDYAISYLETIKHIFDIHGMVFILAVDHSQLQATAKSLFGTEMNFDEYLRKFVQRRVSLPEIETDEDRNGVISHYLEKYLYDEKRKAYFKGSGWAMIEEIFTLCRPNLRQSQEIFRIIAHTMPRSRGAHFDTPSFSWSVCVVYLSVISVMQPEFFRRIIRNANNFQHICENLDNHLKYFKHSNKNWLMRILTMGCFSSSKNKEENVAEVLKTLQTLGYEDKYATPAKFEQKVLQHDPEWIFCHLHENVFQKICTNIVTVKRFAE